MRRKSAPLKVNLNNTGVLFIIPRSRSERLAKAAEFKPLGTSCCSFAPLDFQGWLRRRRLLLSCVDNGSLLTIARVAWGPSQGAGARRTSFTRHHTAGASPHGEYS